MNPSNTVTMKKSSFVFLLIFSVFFLQAQDKIPSFGNIEKADLEMKDCDFDAGAEALVLLDIGEIDFNYVPNVGWVSETYYRIRIKVFKEKGIKRAEIEIPYVAANKRENISNIGGISYNLDANGKIEESRLEAKNIYDKIINKTISQISFAMPNVKAGTVFEYKYKSFRKSYSYIPSWYFQQEIPVKYSAYNLVIPEYFQFASLVTKRQEVEKMPSSGIKEGTWYIMRNIRGLKDEPYSSGRKDYVQRIDFQLSSINAPGFYQEVRTTWAKIIEELREDEDFGLTIKKNLPGVDDILSSAKSMQKTGDKIRAIYKYVQRSMQWNRSYRIYSENGIKDAWDKKNGNIADINFILINMLKEADIPAKPLLVSTKDNGMVNEYYPFLTSFNAVMAYVNVDGMEYVLNAADKYNPYNLVPYDVINTNALVVDKSVEGLIRLKESGKYSNNVFFTCSINADGTIEGQAALKSDGYARNIRMSTFKKNKLKELIEDNAGITIKADSITVDHDKDELLPLEQKIEFSGNMQTGGDYFFLPYSLFTGLDKNPFIEENRVMDIDFNYPKSYVVTGTYYLPDDFVVNELPKNTKMIMPDTSIILTRRIQAEGNIISFRLTIDLLYAGYTAEGYPYLKEFFKKMYAIIDERIVLKKK